MDADLASYVAAWRDRFRRYDEECRALLAQAQASLPSLARELRSRFGVTHVWAVGSVVRGDFRPGSDIDLLLEGLDERSLIRAMAELEETAKRPVDLIRVESLSPERLAFLNRERVEIG